MNFRKLDSYINGVIVPVAGLSNVSQILNVSTKINCWAFMASYWYLDDQKRVTYRLMGGSGIKENFGTFSCPDILIGEVALKFSGLSASFLCENKRAFIIADEAVVKHAEEVREVLEENGFTSTIWTGGEPEPPLEIIETCGEEMREFEPDLVLGVGGGSTMDLAKMARIQYELPSVDLRDVEPLVPLGLGKKALVAAIPTTAGTGSEVTWAAVGTDESASPPRKVEVTSAEIVPDFAILVPRFTAGMPKPLTAGSGLDALAHSFGAYLSSLANIFTDPLALQGIRMVFDWLPKAYEKPDDMEARHKMLLAATISGLAFGNSQTALTHSLGHAVGKAYGIHHGVAVGLFIPYCLQYYSKVTDKYVDMARYLGIEGEGKEDYLDKLLTKFKDFLDYLDVSIALKDHGIDEDEWEEELDTIAKYAEEDVCTLASPRPTSQEEMKKILEYAYEGKDIDF